jgi:hypothetical protein
MRWSCDTGSVQEQEFWWRLLIWEYPPGGSSIWFDEQAFWRRIARMAISTAWEAYLMVAWVLQWLHVKPSYHMIFRLTSLTCLISEMQLWWVPRHAATWTRRKESHTPNRQSWYSIISTSHPEWVERRGNELSHSRTIRTTVPLFRPPCCSSKFTFSLLKIWQKALLRKFQVKRERRCSICVVFATLDWMCSVIFLVAFC